jgi:glycerate kinase
LHGKVVDGVARAAKQAGARVAVLAGCVELNEPGLWPAAVKTVRATQPAGMPLKQAVTEGDVLLEKAAEQLAREEMKL